MKGRFLLNVVVRERKAILKLLSHKNEMLLIRWNTFLVLDLCLNIADGVRRLHIEGNGFALESFYENLWNKPARDGYVRQHKEGK